MSDKSFNERTLPVGVEQTLAEIEDIEYGDGVQLAQLDPNTAKPLTAGILIKGYLCGRDQHETMVRIRVGNLIYVSGYDGSLNNTSAIQRIDQLDDSTYRVTTKSGSLYHLMKVSVPHSANNAVEKKSEAAPAAQPEPADVVPAQRGGVFGLIKRLLGKK